MRKAALLIAAFLLLSLTLHADMVSSPSTWTWENYKGPSQWSVHLTEDDTACGSEAPSYSTETVAVQHDTVNIAFGDWGHGITKGRVSGNSAHMDARTVEDSPGQSYLHAFDIVFSPDCKTFSGKYIWDYSGPEGGCTGTTALEATAINYKGCPGTAATPKVESTETPDLRSQVTDARTDLDAALSAAADFKSLQDSASRNALEKSQDGLTNDDLLRPQAEKLSEQQKAVEAKYKAILDKDPANFWANWDMAQLKKAEGENRDYLKYIDSATSGSNIFEATREKVKAQALKDAGLTAEPSPAFSPALKHLSNELSGWSSGSINGIMVDKSKSDPKSISDYFYAIMDSKSYKTVRELVGLPQANGG